MLFSESASIAVLGSLLNDTTLLSDKYRLTKEDFKPNLFYQIVFITINTLTKNGCKSIDSFDADQFLLPYVSQHETFLDNDGISFIDNIKEMHKEENYESYYNIVRKFTLLRKYKDNGYDISKFYNEDIDENKALENLNKYSINDIIDYYDGLQSNIRREFNSKGNVEEYVAGTDFAKTKEKMKEEPLIGGSFQSPYMNDIFRGMRGFLLRGGKSGGGKAQPVNTIIPTPNGYRKLGDIKVGDYVYDRLGNPTKVLGVFPQGIIDSYTVTLSDGRQTKCNGEHLWSYYDITRNNNKLITRTLNEILQLKNPIYIPINNAIEYNKKEYDINPYIIGSFIGNGCCRERILTLSSNDYEQVNMVGNLLNCDVVKSDYNYDWYFIPKNKKQYSISKNNIKYLQTKHIFNNYSNEIMTYSREKHIPTEYKYGSIEQRFELLQGLFDTDGAISYNDGRYNLTYSTSSEMLAKDISEIIYSLGYSCSIHKDKRRKYINYKINVNIDNSEKYKFFRLSRKLNIAKQAINKPQRRYYNRIRIKSIEKDFEKQEMVCIYVDNDEHLYLTNDYIVTHNTTFSIADLCKVTIKEYYDVESQCYIPNLSREGAGLFINTEMDLREELDPLIIAWISNVPRNHIMDGHYEGDEEARVDYAEKVLLDSELYVVDMPEFTCKSLEETIADYVYNKKIKNVCFDYLCNNGFVSKELSSENKIPMREDIVLLQLTDRLKQCQHKYGIALITGCQLNGLEDNMDYPTEACLAGAKAQVRKTDGTYIMLPPTKKELEATRPILARVMENKPFKVEEPNNVIHIVKGRSSKYEKHIKVFQYADLGTARTYDLFCTNKNNEPIKVNKLIIERDVDD